MLHKCIDTYTNNLVKNEDYSIIIGNFRQPASFKILCCQLFFRMPKLSAKF